MVVVASFVWSHNRSYKDQNPSDKPIRQDTSLLSRARSVVLSSTHRKERGNWTPALSGIIKAGDETIFSSSLLNAQHRAASELSLQDLYETFANELRSRPAIERAAYVSEINRFLATYKSVQRKQPASVSPPRRPDLPKRASRKSVDMIRNSIDLGELGIGRSRSTRKAAATLVTLLNDLPAATDDSRPVHTNWDQDLRHPLAFQGHSAILVTAQELSALSVVLGSPVDISLDAQDEKCDSWANTYKGALGISITATATSDGSYHISLASNKRSISQLPAKGSGYSILHAKHLASSSLPFASERKATDSIIITNRTLEHLKKGTYLSLQPTNAETTGAQFLVRLPNSRVPKFHTYTPSPTASSSHSHLLAHAIGDLVFTGGLTPFAATPLIKTVRFVACGGLVPGRLLQRLDALVGKVHHQAPHLQLFGPLLEDSNAHLRFRVNERLAKTATGTPRDEALADKVARMSRYVTLLERLMALVPDMSSTEVLKAVRAGMQSEMERSYEGAVAAHLLGGAVFSAPSSRQSKRMSSPSQRSSSSSNNSAGTASPDGPASFTSGRSSSTFPKHNLGRQLEDVLKSNLPLDVPTIIMVARLVLVAWTLSVESVAWEDGETGFRVVDPARLPERMYMW